MPKLKTNNSEWENNIFFKGEQSYLIETKHHHFTHFTSKPPTCFESIGDVRRP